MKRKAVIVLFVIGVLLSAFQGTNSYFRISVADVTLSIPKGFPNPTYTFNDNPLRAAVFVLGRKLFYDPILSKDSTVSCASCHIRLAAFGHFDHALSHGIEGRIGRRNVPPLQNLIWKDAFMWDGGVNHLELQPISPITNHTEMDETLKGVLEKLSHKGNYKSDFFAAFGDSMPTSAGMLKALAQFTGLMISANSRYDKYMQGTDTFSAEEIAGLAIFRAKCAVCHTEPLFTNNAYKSNGLPADTSLNDKGRAAITGADADTYKFKVPSLRNIAMTYPYMHDGRFRKLQDVLLFYSHPEHLAAHRSPEMENIGTLTDTDKKCIYSFLQTLTDKSFIYDRRFIDPFMQ
jgi:cytochrome c peroxidase